MSRRALAPMVIGLVAALAAGYGSSVGVQPLASIALPPPRGTVQLYAGCNNIALSFPDGTDSQTVVQAVTPAGVVEAMWRHNAAQNRFEGFSPAAPQASDLLTVNLWDAVWICITASVVGPVPTPEPTGTPAGPSSSNGVFDVMVLVDPQGRQIPQADITRVFALAASRMLEKTGQRMELLDVIYDLPRGSGVSDLADNYLSTTTPDVPEGILILSEDEQARAQGGYSFFIRLPPPFSNEFESPRPDVGGDVVYVAVIHFDHFYARCGYDDNWNHISDVALDGECRNQPGTPCVQQDGRWICENLQGYPYSDHDFFIASNIVHEFLHPFGIDPDPTRDHYGTPECMSRTGMTPEQAADLYQAQMNMGMCPDLFSRFRPSS